MMRRSFLFAIMLLTVALGSGPLRTQAQGAGTPNVMVVYQNPGVDTRTAAAYTPDGVGTFTQPLTNDQLSFASAPDGSTQLIAHATEGSYLEINRGGQFPNRVNISDSVYPRVRFSADSRWVIYDRFDDGLFRFGLVEVATNKHIVFTANATTLFGFGTVPLVQSYRNGRLYFTVVGYEGPALIGVYAVQLPNLATVAEGTYPLPGVARLLGAVTDLTDFAISPDGSKLALFSGDQSNPPTEWTPMGPGGYANAVSVLDLTTAQRRFIARAGSGQALATMAWTPDSSRILFTGGNYKNTAFLVNAKLYEVTVANGQVKEIGPAVNDPMYAGYAKFYVQQLMACGTTLYSVITDTAFDQQGEVFTATSLTSAPLSAPGTGKALLNSKVVTMSGCTSLR
jgi:hypothetical protein